MAIKKITFTNANVTAQNDADLYYFLQGGTGILKGIKNEIKASNNANRFIFEDGYVSIYGRLLFVDNNTDITVPLNRTAMGYVVLDINTATNSAELTYTEATNGGYPVLIQENLSAGAGRYQLPLAAYSKTGAALTPDQSFKPAYLYPHMERQQGASNAGKVLAVGTDGYIILMNQSGINAGQLEGHPASYFQEKQEGKGLSTNDYDDTEKEAVAANTAARHSHSNKAVLDGITQEIVNKADSLKYDAEGKISPDLIPSAGINVKSADTAYKDEAGRNIKGTFDKGLYNLGAFDTVTDNKDGTATITRKTGFVDLGSLNWSSGDYYSTPFNAPDEVNGKTPKYLVYSNYSSWVNASSGLVIVNNTIRVKTNTTPSGILQYELASSYTEKVIMDERNNHVDDFSRGQWEKSINLFNKNDIIRGCGLNGQGGVDYQYTNYFVPNFIPVKPNTTYTYSGATSSFDFYDINKNFIYMRGQYGTFTTPDNCYFVRFNALLTLLDSLMLNEGDHALPYQPFDYSGHIQNEQGRYLIEHNKNARNLLDPLSLTSEPKESRYCERLRVNADGSISLNVTGTDDPFYYVNIQNLKLKKGTYTLSFESNKDLQQIGLTPAEGTGYVYGFASGANGSKVYTFTEDIEVGLGLEFIQTGDNIITVWLNKGDKPLPYTPYNSKEHITNQQADLLESEEKRSRNVWDEQWEQGIFDGSGQPASSGLTIRTKNFIPVDGCATYTLGYPMEIGADAYEYDADQNFINYIDCPHKNTSFTTKPNTKYLKFRLSTDYGNTYKNDIMLNKGTEALPYEPYAGQIIHETDLLEALKIYGEMPAITSIAFNTSDWENIVNNQNFSKQVTIAGDITQFTTNTTYTGHFKGPTVYPLKASNSISKCEITRVSGSDKLAYTASVNTSTGEIKLTCTARPYEGSRYPTIYGMGYSSGSYPTEESTFKLEVSDIYGNSFTFTFTVQFKYAAS